MKRPLSQLLHGPQPVQVKALLWYYPQLVYIEDIKTTFVYSNPHSLQKKVTIQYSQLDSSSESDDD